MKHLTCILLIGILLGAGCRKDTESKTQDSNEFPVENNQVRIDIVPTSAPSGATDALFFNASTGIVVTFDGRVYKTVDGGITWDLKYSSPAENQPLYQLLFVDAHIGYAVGGSASCGGTGCIPPGGLILKTTDGGNTWITILQRQNIECVSIAANSAGDLFVITDGVKREILTSDDDGVSWTTAFVANTQLMEIVFQVNYGFCTTGDGKILRSSDKGTTWSLLTTIPNAIYLTNIKFIGETGYCIANNQNVYQTTDYGNSWTQKLGTEYGTFKISPLTEDNCLAFGAGTWLGGDMGRYNAKIMQTTNAGRNWTATILKSVNPIRCASFYSATEGYAFAGSSLVKITVK